MFVGIRADYKLDGLRFVVNRCYATPTPRMPRDLDDEKYVFFDSKCPVDPTFEVVDVGNYHFNFRMDAFSFIRTKYVVSTFKFKNLKDK